MANAGAKILGNLLANDPEKFKAEMGSLNTLEILREKKNKSKFSLTDYYIKKGSETPTRFAKYPISADWSTENESEYLQLQLSTPEIDYLPVKLKNKYKLVFTNIQLDLTAFVQIQNDEKKVIDTKLVTLGSVNVNLISVGLKTIHILNGTNTIPLPKQTDKGQKITIQSILISAKISYQNPVGETINNWSEYLLNDSESHIGLIQSLGENR